MEAGSAVTNCCSSRVRAAHLREMKYETANPPALTIASATKSLVSALISRPRAKSGRSRKNAKGAESISAHQPPMNFPAVFPFMADAPVTLRASETSPAR